MKPSPNCIELIRAFEGCKLEPYLDAVGIPTIGFGSTHYEDNSAVEMLDKPITEDVAEDLLYKHVTGIAVRIDGYIEVDLSQNQVDALLSLIYNIGEGNFKSSTLLKLLNNGEIEKASEQILVWNKARGEVLAGLVKRREAEQKLFLS